MRRLTESSEYSTESREKRVEKTKTSADELQRRQQPTDCKLSKFLQELSKCMGSNVSVPKLSWFKSMTQIVGLTAA